MLNELRLHRAELEERLEILEMEYRDCMLSAPDEDGSKTAETTRIEALLEKLASLQTRKKEISTTINQYRLLKERSLQDRDEAEMKMHQSKGTAEAAEDDLRTITAFFYDSQVEQDKAERLLGEAISQLDISRTEWQKRTREVRKRVEALQRAKLREEKEETERKEIEIKKKEVAALERNAAIEQQAALEAEMNNPEVLAQLEKAEALWARLQGASGCRQPQDIILAYNDLHQRSNALQNLLFLAKKKEQNFQDSLLAVSHYGTQQTEQKTVDHPCQAVNDSNDAEQRIGAQMQRLEKVCAIAELSLASLRNRLVNIHQSTTRDPLTKNREGEKSVSDTTSIAESCNSLMDEIEALLQEISEYKNMNDEGGALLGSGITNGSSLASMQPPMHRRGTFIGSPWWPASGVTMNNGATTDSSKPDKVEQGGSGGDDDGVLERNFSDLEVGLKVKKDEAEYNEAEDEGEGDEDDEVAGHMTVLSIQDRYTGLLTIG